MTAVPKSEACPRPRTGGGNRKPEGRTILLLLFWFLVSGFWYPVSAFAACSTPGQMTFNSDHHVMQYCDGTNWIAAGPIDPPNAGQLQITTSGLVWTYTINATSSAALSNPYKVAYDSTNKRLFVADYADNRVLVYDLSKGVSSNSLSAVAVLGQADFSGTSFNQCNCGTTTASTLYHPAGLAWDPVHSRLFVADSFNSRILVFDLSGGITNGMAASWVLGSTSFTSISGTTNQSRAGFPTGLAYDSGNQRLFVGEVTTTNRLVEYDLSGGISNGMNATHVLGQSSWSGNTASSAQAGMSSPYGVAYDSANNRLFVADSYNMRVTIFDLSGGITDGMNALYEFGQTGWGTSTIGNGQAGMHYPWDVSYDPVGQRLFVADSSNSRVLDFDLSGTISNGMNAAYELGQPSFTLAGGPMKTVYAALYDTTLGMLFVGDFQNAQVEVFPPYASCTNTTNVTNGLLAWWQLNDGTGSNALDSSGQGNVGQMGGHAGTWTAAGKFGGAISLSGSSQYLSVNNAASLSGMAALTVSAWVYVTNGTAQQAIVSKQQTAGTLSYLLDVVNNNLDFQVRNASSTLVDATASGGLIPNNTWTLITGVYDGANVSVYVNGALAGTPVALTGNVYTSTSYMEIGSLYPTGAFFAGTLDDVRVYNRALSNAEIMQLYYGTQQDGNLGYNNDHHVMQYCASGAWRAMGPAGTGGSGCTSPAGSEGRMIYNNDHNIMQYCNGTSWIGIGK